MRNDRIETTKRICDIDKVMYHLITRSKIKWLFMKKIWILLI